MDLQIRKSKTNEKISRKLIGKFQEATENTNFRKIWENEQMEFDEKYTTWSRSAVEILKAACTRRKGSKAERKEIRIMRRKRKELKKCMIDEKNRNTYMIHQRRRDIIQQHIIKAMKVESGKKVEKVAKEIMNKGIFNRAAYWDFMKAIPKKRIVKGTAVNDKDGKRIDEPAKVKERYAEYFKELLTVRKARNEDERRVEETVDRCFDAMRKKAEQIPIEPMTDKEYEEMKQSLKKDKAQDKEG